MAFQKDKTTAAQTAGNVAGNVAAAALTAGKLDVDSAAEFVVDVFEALFTKLAPIVDADNANFLAQEGAAPASKTAKSGGERSYSKTRSSKTRGNSSVSLDDALGMELNFGAFGGETMGNVLALSADDADEQYGYGDGERSGRDYITWLATDKNKNDYVRTRARVIADSEGISY
ncbi:MAG: hypothetical protein V4510_12820 [bacterium]